MSLVKLQELKNHYGDDIDIISDLIEIFESSYLETLNSLKESISTGNYKEIELHAHTLKGMVANFFGEETKLICFELEKMGRAQELKDAQEKVDKIEQQIPIIITELKAI